MSADSRPSASSSRHPDDTTTFSLDRPSLGSVDVSVDSTESSFMNAAHEKLHSPSHSERPVEHSPTCLGQQDLYVDHLIRSHRTTGSSRQRNVIFEVLLPETKDSDSVDNNPVI